MEAIEGQPVVEGEEIRGLHDDDVRILSESLHQLRVPAVDERGEHLSELRADKRVVEADDEDAGLRIGPTDHLHYALYPIEHRAHHRLRIAGHDVAPVVSPQIVSADGDDDHVGLPDEHAHVPAVELPQQIGGPRAIDGQVDDVLRRNSAALQLIDQASPDAKAGFIARAASQRVAHD